MRAAGHRLDMRSSLRADVARRPAPMSVPRTARILDLMRMGPHMMMPGDADAVKGKRFERSALRRAWDFAHPYRGTIVLFLIAILVAALLGLVPPFAFKYILDDAIPNED